jgi:hypothetical protein
LENKICVVLFQLFDLNNGEMEWLANHMGHDIKIHKDFYRLHDSTIEIAKVSRLLLAIDAGKAAKFKGKGLEDINIDGIILFLFLVNEHIYF